MKPINHPSVLTKFVPVLALGLASCATTQPPAELVQARTAYKAGLNGPAARHDPAGLHDAKVALNRAESSFADDGDSQETKDAAYVALRRSQQAQIDGETAELRIRQEQAERAAIQRKSQEAQTARSELESTRGELATAQQERAAAEATARDALMHLEETQTAAVKEEERGTVITVAGAFLFPSGKANLLPTAQGKLDQIADALRGQEEKKILIEGHADATGPDDLNMELSRERAETVAGYLSERGIPRDQISTEGRGSAAPVASNKTSEGRANNRRVEIIIEPTAT